MRVEQWTPTHNWLPTPLPHKQAPYTTILWSYHKTINSGGSRSSLRSRSIPLRFEVERRRCGPRLPNTQTNANVMTLSSQGKADPSLLVKGIQVCHINTSVGSAALWTAEGAGRGGVGQGLLKDTGDTARHNYPYSRSLSSYQVRF